MASFKKRKVNESELYRSGRDTLLSVYPRLNEILEGIISKIVLEPTRFPRLLGMETRRARTDAFPPELPSSYAVWFNHDRDTVTLELIELWRFDESVAPDDESTLGESD